MRRTSMYFRWNHLLPAFLVLACTLAWSNPAAAADHRFILHLGVMNIDGHVNARGHAEGYRDSLGFDSERIEFADLTVPRFSGQYRFTQRNRLLFNYFRYAPGRSYTLDVDVEIEGMIVPAGSRGRLDTGFKLGTLVYDRAVVDGDRVGLGLQIGTAWGAIEGRVGAEVDGHRLSERERRSGFAPVLGLRLGLHSADHRWIFTAQGQYMNVNWGNLDRYNGDLARLNALLEYRPLSRVGVHFGYDSFRLDIDHDFGRIIGGATVHFAGPVAGLTVAF